MFASHGVDAKLTIAERGKDGVYQSTFTGGVSHTNFRKFIGALDLIRPISSDKIGEYNYGESYRGSGISWNEAELINYLPVINIDGGLPGEACLEVSNAMMKTRAGNSFLRASNVITPLVEKLEEQGVRYNERVMVYNDDDSYICFVPGDNDAILHTKLSLFTEYNSFLAFNRKDVHEETVETVFIPLKRGSDVLDAVEVLSTNNEGDLLQASFCHLTGKIKMSNEFIETGCLHNVSFYTDYAFSEVVSDRENAIEFREFSKFLELHQEESDELSHSI